MTTIPITPYRAGLLCALNNLPTTYCPWREGSPPHLLWHHGYNDGLTLLTRS